MMFSKEVFPDPLGPIIATSSPGLTNPVLLLKICLNFLPDVYFLTSVILCTTEPVISFTSLSSAEIGAGVKKLMFSHLKYARLSSGMSYENIFYAYLDPDLDDFGLSLL